MGGKKVKSKVKELKNELEEKNKQIEEYQNRIKYLQADFENYEKRVAMEKEDLTSSAKEPLILKVIEVYENLERALTNGTEGSKEALLKGVEMTYMQMKKVLEEEGVTEIKAVGEKFDPSRHEALMNEQKDDCEEGTILEEFQRGYMLKDKVIRYSKVKIAKR
jgi:molecular chaperone GrpE